jgi:predicted alpha/beta-hydrolase family hydrolase
MTRPLFLFTPGAGAPSSHPWMQRWKERLSTLGEVVTFDYPYMREGRKRPDRLPQLISAHRQALMNAQQGGGGPVFLIGKSMGGRIGCHVALEESVAGVLCFGYPLCGGGDPAKLRDKVLRELRTPILFVQGTRDALCPLDLLKPIIADMNAQTFLHVVDGGDHSLMVLKRELQKRGETQGEVDERMLGAIAQFVGRFCETPALRGV